MKPDRRIDAYIARAAPFARPILQHLRHLVHRACPEAEETIKWSRPFFLRHGLLCAMSAFQHHCSFGFWLHDEVLGKADRKSEGKDGMGQFGRITSLKDLPADEHLLDLIRKAAALNESGIKRTAPPRPAGNRELAVPEFILTALRKQPKALAAFDAFSYSHKKEYVEWITEARREETCNTRIQTMLAWLKEGKSRHWKYTRGKP